MKYRVFTQPEADDQALDVGRWWRANRLAAPQLFEDELSAAFALLAEAPGVGRRYSAHGIPGLRRLMLPATRYHVYYVFDSDRGDVIVLAIWSAVRGASPSLKPPR